MSPPRSLTPFDRGHRAKISLPANLTSPSRSTPDGPPPGRAICDTPLPKQTIFGSVSPFAPPGEGDRITTGVLRFQPVQPQTVTYAPKASPTFHKMPDPNFLRAKELVPSIIDRLDPISNYSDVTTSTRQDRHKPGKKYCRIRDISKLTICERELAASQLTLSA